jgi:hypothetical protein
MAGRSVFAQWESVMETQYFSDGTLKAATKNTHYAETEGSPFFYDNWTPGEASLSDGKTYKDVLLKYDEVTNTLMFKYAVTDSPMVFKFRPLAFKFNYIDSTPFIVDFANGFEPVDGGTADTFYQVLADGKTKLLKRCVKTITESQAFGSNETRKRISDVNYYYLTKDKRLLRVKRDKKSVLNALADKADQLKTYLAKNDIDLDNETDFARLITYYNTL